MMISSLGSFHPSITPSAVGFPSAEALAMPRKATSYKTKYDSFEKTGDGKSEEATKPFPWLDALEWVAGIGCVVFVLYLLSKHSANREKAVASSSSPGSSGASNARRSVLDDINKNLQDAENNFNSWDAYSSLNDPFSQTTTTSTPFGNYTSSWNDWEKWTNDLDDLFDNKSFFNSETDTYIADFYELLESLQNNFKKPKPSTRNSNGSTQSFDEWFNANYRGSSRTSNQSTGSTGHASQASGNNTNHGGLPANFERDFLKHLDITLADYKTITAEELKQKYRTNAKKVHPDTKKLNANETLESATKQFQEFSRLYALAKEEIAKRPKKP